jgi:hypothetical protein
MLRHIGLPVNRNRPRSRAGGKSLVELLVAIALGLLIAASAASLVLAANQTVRVSGGVSSLEESQAIIRHTFGEVLKATGYSEITGTGLVRKDSLVYSGQYIRACSGGHFVDPQANNFSCSEAGNAGNGDSIALWFQGDSVVGASQGARSDCLGGDASMLQSQVAASGVPVVRSVFSIDAVGNLLCLGSSGGDPQLLASGVEQLRFFFGFDEAMYKDPMNVELTPSVTAILTAREINERLPVQGQSPWDFVMAVWVCILVVGPEGGTQIGPHLPCPSDPAEMHNGTSPVTLSDGRQRRSFLRAFPIRSRVGMAPLS